MLTASDLNKVFDHYAEQMLIPLGFKKSGIHYYKKNGAHYYAVIKHAPRGLFFDYYFTYSHEAAGASYNMLQKKPSPMLKDYPVSVAVNDLKIIYANNEKLVDSPYYFFSLSRQYKIGKNSKEDIKMEDKYFLEIMERNEILTSDKIYLESYVDNLFKVISNEGLRFYNDCNLVLCYKAVLRPLEEKKLQQYSKWYQDYLNSFNEYCKVNKIEMPDFHFFAKTKLFNRWFKA
jgi:hypothetical protein